jgi:UDP-N-acetylmuramoyl-L-alanyl-D-glutamate--2,6-diaminopimelate ligase
MLSTTLARKYTLSLKKKADFTERLETKLIGEFNAYNILGVYAAAIILGQDANKVKEIIKKLEAVPGRFQYIKSKSGVTGVVDYAHTPDALLNVLKTVNEMKKNGKVIAVIGCGGDRDRSKRPIMAKIGYDMSDVLILTSDNPRTEKPEAILEEMKKGIEGLYFEGKVYVLVDRYDAIERACNLANPGDFILIAGKGHENYQEVNGIKTHFDDMEELQRNLK